MSIPALLLNADTAAKVFGFEERLSVRFVGSGGGEGAGMGGRRGVRWVQKRGELTVFVGHEDDGCVCGFGCELG